MYLPVEGRPLHKKKTTEAHWGNNPDMGLQVSLQKNREIYSIRSLQKKIAKLTGLVFQQKQNARETCINHTPLLKQLSGAVLNYCNALGGVGRTVKSAARGGRNCQFCTEGGGAGTVHSALRGGAGPFCTEGGGGTVISALGGGQELSHLSYLH